MACLVMIDALKSRIRNAGKLGNDSKYVNDYNDETTGRRTDGYLTKISHLENRLKELNGTKEVHPIEIAFYRDLMAGLKPAAAADKRKKRYRAAIKRRQTTAERGIDDQHRDRKLFEKISGLSRNDLFQTDVIDRALEGCTEVVDSFGTVIVSDESRDAAFREQTRKPIKYGTAEHAMIEKNRAENTDYAAALFKLKQDHSGSKEELGEKIAKLKKRFPKPAAAASSGGLHSSGSSGIAVKKETNPKEEAAAEKRTQQMIADCNRLEAAERRARPVKAPDLPVAMRTELRTTST